ncbi:ABC transporter permease [Enemella evansiae]|uniref:ABC transporter permease n=1 Tax=Enemella evansiae TaxID=2016499 RepID=A0A255GB95_9ACTN|nr:carbohydrate ABC transporter permease [Enemella evansiae]OYN96225.1 ABC transporter permease [Enemella evansiae]OYO12851.1 ABC transporter permease [Enemella evansiae]
MVRRKSSLGSVAQFVTLAVLTVFFMAPIYIMVSAALKPSSQASADQMWQLPSALDFAGPMEAWSRLAPNFMNSLILAIPATLISSLIGAAVGYVFSKFRFRGDRVLFAALMVGMFIPYQVVLVPMVRFLQATGLFGTLGGLILVHCVYGLPIVALIFRNYFAGIPDEIHEAGRVDGAGEASMFVRLFLPLALPGFVVAWIFQFTNIWNDFLFGITVVPDPGTQPVTVALQNLSGNFSVSWNAVMSGALITGLPTMLLYLLLGRFFVQGLTAGSVK